VFDDKPSIGIRKPDITGDLSGANSNLLGVHHVERS
jgi:hypothetical protein